jgi:hypothetical protein
MLSENKENPLFPCFSLMDLIGIVRVSDAFSMSMFLTISLDGNSVSNAKDIGLSIKCLRCKESVVMESMTVPVRSTGTSFTGVHEEMIPIMNIMMHAKPRMKP